MYEFEIKYKLEKKLIKIFKKDSSTYEKIIKKIEEIVNSKDVNHYKNLRNNMKDLTKYEEYFKRNNSRTNHIKLNAPLNKNLKSDLIKNMQFCLTVESKRVHIGSFVLIFSYKDNKVCFEDFNHHDNIYQ